MIANRKEYWLLEDMLAGLIMIDDRREVPQLRALQADTFQMIDRQRAAIARDPLLREAHHWNAYLDGLAAERENDWRDYARLLADDADTTLQQDDDKPN
jgi:hypothetical protein